MALGRRAQVLAGAIPLSAFLWRSAIRARPPNTPEERAELWKTLGDVKTRVYVAGLEKMRPELDRVFAGLAGLVWLA